MNKNRQPVKRYMVTLLALACLFVRPAALCADTVNWAREERSLGITNCVISNADRPNIRVQSLKLDRSSISLYVGQATRLVPEVLPANAANLNVVWKSSNKKIAKVTKSGWVAAKKKGTCRITAYTEDGKKKAVCTVTVKAAPKGSGLKAIKLAKSKLSVYVGETKTIAAKLKTPIGSTPVAWSSSNPLIATVDECGRVLGLRGGTAVITARAVKSGRTAKCRVTVKGQYGIVRLPWQIRRAGTLTTYSAQGSGVDMGTYFKLWNYNTVQLYDFSSGTKKGEFSLDVRHGNLIDFDTVSAPTGQYHDAYVTAETNPAMINVYSFSDSSAVRLRSYIFPLEKTGYNAGHVLDASRGLIYMVGYTKNTFYNPGDCEMIVSTWDIRSASKVREGFYQPRFVSSFRVPFILTLQGQCLRGNSLYIMSSDWVNPDTEIYVISLEKKKVTAVVRHFPTEIKHQEMESIFFVGDGLYIDKNSYIYRVSLQ